MKPKPIPIALICNVCDLPWGDHPEGATVLDCVQLLKNRPSQTIQWSSPCACWCHHQWTFTNPPVISYDTTNDINVPLAINAS